MGSVHFQIILGSGLYFSRSLGLFYVVGANCRVLTCCTCHFQRGSLFILASVCWSLQCLISALTQGGDGGHFFRLTCSVVLWGGRNTANKYHWRVWGVLSVFQLHWVYPCSQRVCFHGLHFSGSRLLCWELSEAGPGLRALPRSKLLRFRFLGTPQRCRLGWACVLCLSRLRAAQVTRCLASGVCRITSPIPATRFSGCTMDAPSQVCPVSLLGS